MKFEAHDSENSVGTCDQCGATATLDNFHRISVQTNSARINQSRHWHFCSAACRALWWEDPAQAALHEITHPDDILEDTGAPDYVCSHDPEHAHIADRDLTIKIHLRDHGDKLGSSATQLFECPCHVNEWWLAPCEEHEKLPVVNVTPQKTLLVSPLKLTPILAAPKESPKMAVFNGNFPPKLPPPIPKTERLDLPYPTPKPVSLGVSLKVKLAAGLVAATALGVTLYEIFGH